MIGYVFRRWRLALVSTLGLFVLIGVLVGLAQAANPSHRAQGTKPSQQSIRLSRPDHGAATTTTTSTSTTTTSTMSPSGVPSTATKSKPLSSPGFQVESCAKMIESPIPNSDVDLRPFLLSTAQLSGGTIVDKPQRTSKTQPVTASVPTTSPTASETIGLSGSTKPGGSTDVQFKEVIGDVGSSSSASQWISMLNADRNAPGCNANPKEVDPLPGTNPPVSATFSGSSQRGRIDIDARLFAAKGSRLVSLEWSGGISLPSSGAAGPKGFPGLPHLPDNSEMAQVLNAALARIPN